MIAAVLLGSAVTSGGGVPPAAAPGPPPITADLGYWSTTPRPPATRLPSPPNSPPRTPASAGRVTSPVGENARPTPSRTTAAPSGPALTPGARVGLEPVTHPGYRVRHRQFVGRIEPVGAGSPAAVKADSTFAVRAGLADSRCVSLEAVNYPGYYLRHQDFAIRLHGRDTSPLFAADATFCPQGGLTGRDVSLRSYNFPDRYLFHQQSQLYIAQPGDRAAMTFAVRAAL